MIIRNSDWPVVLIILESASRLFPDGRKNYMILEILNVVVLEINLLKKKRKLPF